MFLFLSVAAAIASAALARYEGDRLLQEYFWDDDLWDTVSSNDMFIQKCMNDRQWSKLCLCRSNGRRSQLFLCDYDEGYGAHVNALNDDQYDYYFPGTGAIPNKYRAPQPWANTMPNPWQSEYGDLSVPYEAGWPPLERAHLIPKDVLRTFYQDIYESFAQAQRKTVLEPLFDRMDMILGTIKGAPAVAPKWELKDTVGDPAHPHPLKPIVGRLQAFIRGQPLSQNEQFDAEYLFKCLYIWAPGNLVYAPRNRADDPHKGTAVNPEFTFDGPLKTVLKQTEHGDELDAAYNDMVVFHATPQAERTVELASSALDHYLRWAYGPWIRRFTLSKWQQEADGRWKVKPE